MHPELKTGHTDIRIAESLPPFLLVATSFHVPLRVPNARLQRRLALVSVILSRTRAPAVRCEP
jgi:hypothetical protein